MDKYKVMLYPKAIEDIDSIYQYIAMEKLAPETAKEQTDRIWDKIATLFCKLFSRIKIGKIISPLNKMWLFIAVISKGEMIIFLIPHNSYILSIDSIYLFYTYPFQKPPKTAQKHALFDLCSRYKYMTQTS